jgi:hypothetical protein
MKNKKNKKKEQARVDAMVSEAALTDYIPSPQRRAEMELEKKSNAKKNNNQRKA